MLFAEVLTKIIGRQFSKILSRGAISIVNIVIWCENIDFNEDVTKIKQIPNYKKEAKKHKSKHPEIFL